MSKNYIQVEVDPLFLNKSDINKAIMKAKDFYPEFTNEDEEDIFDTVWDMLYSIGVSWIYHTDDDRLKNFIRENY